MTRQRVDAVTLVEDAMIHSYALRVVDVALKDRVPVVVGSLSSLVEACGFMSYGPNRAELWRNAALLTDKIIRGAKPGDLRATLRVAYAGSGVAQDATHLFTTGSSAAFRQSSARFGPYDMKPPASTRLDRLPTTTGTLPFNATSPIRSAYEWIIAFSTSVTG